MHCARFVIIHNWSASVFSLKGQRRGCLKEVIVTGISDVLAYLSESLSLVKFEVLAHLGYCAALIGS